MMQPLHTVPFPSDPPPEERMQHNEGTDRRHLIMVIEDSPTCRKILLTALSRAGFTVLGFGDGIAAMRWLSQPGSHLPDLVLLDVGLPKLDGFEIAHRLKSHPSFQRTAVIMLSRHSGVLPRLKARLAGATTYLTKPVPTEELLSVIASHLGRADAQDTKQGHALEVSAQRPWQEWGTPH